MEIHEVLEKLENTAASWLRIYWCDYTSSIKCRLIPMDTVMAKLRNNEPVSLTITKASLGLLPNDHLIPGMAGVGGYTLVPDWSSLRAGPVPGQVTCVGEFRDKKDGSDVALCTRTVLRRCLERATRHGLRFILGFEIEFVVMERNPDRSSAEQYLTLSNDGHAWSSTRNLADWGRSGSFNTALDEIASRLKDSRVAIEQFQTESAPGQYEIVLQALPALEACDTYLLTRQLIESVAAKHGFRVTLHPKPFFFAPGNATHVHMSISSTGGNNANLYEPFYAGILKHLRAIIAFTYTSPASYERLADSSWAGGRWIGWGTENRETPLRKCEEGHWEFRPLDGLANPYLALAAILGAGTAGVAEKMDLSRWKDCLDDPAMMSSAQRDKVGITERLPQSLTEALESLQADESICELMDPAVVERHVAMKKAEMALLESVGKDQWRQWIIARF